MRRRILQGAPYKTPLIRELLWDWFVDMRASIASNISPKFMLMKARSIADRILLEQRKLGLVEPMPVIDKHWLMRFKKDKCIVFRRPNQRFKCSREKLLRRLRAMWLNVIRVRRFAELTLGSDLAEAIYGVDEKPVHFNESGSKVARTLEIEGAPCVKLKENHANTRERVSVMTCVTSSPRAAGQPRRLPLEILFRAKSGRRTRSLKVPADSNVSISWSSKGSYKGDDFVRYLERWLDPWTPQRAEQRDYRILMLDVAASHCDPRVADVAWARGYIVLYHYGCTTAVAQVNDTDLHMEFSRVYMLFEQEAFLQQQVLDPGFIGRHEAFLVRQIHTPFGFSQKQHVSHHAGVA